MCAFPQAFSPDKTKCLGNFPTALAAAVAVAKFKESPAAYMQELLEKRTFRVKKTTAGPNTDTKVKNLELEFTCPITLEVMKEPVVAADGYSYEKNAIKKWLKKNTTSPVTGASLITKNLVDS